MYTAGHCLDHSWLEYSTTVEITVQYSTVQYSTVQYNSEKYSTIQCSTEQLFVGSHQGYMDTALTALTRDTWVMMVTAFQHS